MSSLQDRVNQVMLKETKQDYNSVSKEHGFVANKSDGTPTVHQENMMKVVLPEGMNKLQGAHNLIKQFEEEETFRVYNRNYTNFFANDFMIAMQVMIKKYFGMLHVSQRDTGGNPASNDYIQIPTNYDENGNLVSVQGYVGSIKAPCWEDAVIDIAPCSIAVRAKLKFEGPVNRFLEDVQDYILRNSVVKGTAVKIKKIRGGALMSEPINPKQNKTIVLNSETERVVNNLIIPSLADYSKTSILMTGDFGTGKTETAIRVGVQGQKLFGRTFFYLHNAELFSALIPYIKNYAAACVFVEDVDQISAGDRDSGMNDLLNQLDGNELKNVNCTFIFTTNNHKKIHPAMRRPGRIDQVVHFDYCDKESIAKIFEIYANGMEGADSVDYALAAEKTPENLQGAVVAEIARRAKKYSEKLYKGIISTDRFLDAIASMRHHIEFMREDQEKDFTAENLIGHIFYTAMTKAFPNMEEADLFQGSKYKELNK